MGTWSGTASGAASATIVSRRAGFIYHAELSGGAGEKKTYKDNLWRLNLKLSFPRRGQRVSSVLDVDP